MCVCICVCRLGYKASIHTFAGPWMTEEEIIHLANDPNACGICNFYFSHPRWVAMHKTSEQPQVASEQVPLVQVDLGAP